MKSKLLLIILSCAVLALIWFLGRMRTPLSKVYDDALRKLEVDTRGWDFKQAPLIETEPEVLFHQDMNGYNTTRIPALVYYQDIFFAFAEGRRETFYDIGEMDIILRRGRRKDWKVAWGPIEIIARQSGYRMMDPVPIVDTQVGTILLVYNAHPASLDQWDELDDEKITTTLYVVKSYDLGESWTNPQEINNETIERMKPRPRMYGPGPGHGIQMTSGRLIVPGKIWTKIEDPKQIGYRNGTFSQAIIIYSDDHGRTWKPGGSVSYGVDTYRRAIYSSESTAVELDNSRLCINARTLHPDQPRVLSFSNDGGESFSTPYLERSLEEPGYYIEDHRTLHWNNTQQGPFLLQKGNMKPNAAGGCQGSTIGFPAPYHQPLSSSSRWVIFANPASPTTRRNLAVKLSKDGCRTWSKPWIIHPNASAYSDMAYFGKWDMHAGVYSPNIAIVYEAGRGQDFPYETIQFKMFSL